jgi:large subunit ribosomal protein L15
MELNNLKPKKGSRHARKRVGRGQGSGHGKMSSRGEKGQKSRSGYSRMLGFEGGQMPLHRRVPKRGFTNIFRVEYSVVNVADLEKAFEAGATVDVDALRKAGLIRGRKRVKVLGNGDIKKKITVHADKFSDSAKSKIEAAGGTCQEIK